MGYVPLNSKHFDGPHVGRHYMEAFIHGRNGGMEEDNSGGGGGEGEGERVCIKMRGESYKTTGSVRERGWEGEEGGQAMWVS